METTQDFGTWANDFSPEWISQLQDLAEEDGLSIEALDEFCANWCSERDEPSEVLERFAESYQGEFDSMDEFAQHILEDTGMLDTLPEWAQGYFDFEAYGRDLRLSGDYWISKSGHVFRND
jgi:antirestriction protein